MLNFILLYTRLFSNMISDESKPDRAAHLSRFLVWLNLLAAVFLLTTQIAPAISPEDWWFFELIANSYPFAVLVNILFLVIWGIKRHRFFFISASILLTGYDKLGRLYQPGWLPVDTVAPVNSVKVISYNVRLFDLYNWTGNLKTRNKIFDFLSIERPDILCLQEYYSSDKGDFENNNAIRRLTKLPYSTIKYGITLRKTDHWGMATFSRFPIINEGTVFYEAGKSNFGIYSDLVIGNDTVRVYNVHLQSNHFKSKDYQLIANAEGLSNDSLIEGTRSILGRIKRAVIRRSRQVNELRAHMDECRYPILLCGDFNDPPFSYAYQTLSQKMEDAFEEKGEGFGNTYFGFPIKFRIDYLLHSPEWKTHSFVTGEQRLSDHYPVISRLSLH